MVSPPLFSVCRARLVTSNTLTLSKTTWPTPNWSLPTASRLARLKTTSLTPQRRDWSKSFAQDLTNQKGENAWPITSTTFILVHKATNKPEQTAEVLKFFDWAYKNGGKEANALDYATLPESVVEQVRAAWKPTSKTAAVKRCTNSRFLTKMAGAFRRCPPYGSDCRPGSQRHRAFIRTSFNT